MKIMSPAVLAALHSACSYCAGLLPRATAEKVQSKCFVISHNWKKRLMELPRRFYKTLDCMENRG